MTGPRRLAGWAFDAAAVAAALSVRLRAWPRQPPQGVSLDVPEGWWQWGGLHDMVLAGADSGAWAANVRALLEGQTLDIHRLPVFLYLTAGMTRFFEDIIFAGHVVNHLLSLVVVAITYAFGRSTSGRAAALAAALLVALSPELVESQFDMGVDPSLQLTLLLVVVTSWLGAARGALWIPVAGLAVGVAMSTHYLALVFAAPALAMLVFSDRAWWGRILSVLAAGGVGWASWRLLLSPYPDLSTAEVLAVFSEGISSTRGRDTGESLGFSAAVELVASRWDGAMSMTVGRGLKGLSAGHLPWMSVVILFWIGVFAPGPRRAARGPIPWDWRPSLWFLVFLAPLLALEMARAMERYALYARPLLFLCVARGAVSVGFGVDAVARRLWGRWPSGLVAFLPAAGLVAAMWTPLQAAWRLDPPTAKGLLLREAGGYVAEGWGTEGTIATFNRDLAYFTGRETCMTMPCPGSDDLAVGQCLEDLRLACEGEGPLLYAIEYRDRRGFGDQPNAALDKLVTERFEKLKRWESRELSLELYRIGREQLAAVVQELAGGRLRQDRPAEVDPQDMERGR